MNNVLYIYYKCKWEKKTFRNQKQKNRNKINKTTKHFQYIFEYILLITNKNKSIIKRQQMFQEK